MAKYQAEYLVEEKNFEPLTHGWIFGGYKKESKEITS